MKKLNPNRLRNADVRPFVESRREFSNTAGSLWSTTYGYGSPSRERYCVFSYGPHFPLFVYTNGKWFGNKDKYSPTTSRHTTYSRPRGVGITWLSTRHMCLLVERGLIGMGKYVLEGKEV